MALVAHGGCSQNAATDSQAPALADVSDAQTAGSDAVATTGGDTASPVDAEPVGPQAQFSPELLDFGPVDTGSCASKTVALSNEGDQALQVKGLNLQGLSPQFKVEWWSPAPLGGQAEVGGKLWVLPAPVAVAPGQSAGLSVQFCPTAPGPVAAAVQLLGDGAPATLKVKALAVKSKVVCLDLAKWSDPLTAQLGGVVPGQTEGQIATVKNCGSEALAIVNVQLIEIQSSSDPEFSIDWSKQVWGSKVGPGPISAANPLTIQPSGEAVFRISYTPADVSPQTKPDKATLVATLSNGQQLVKEFSGWGIELKCPVAKIVVQEGESVAPHTKLHLNGKQSLTAKGVAIAKYLWTVDQPAGSVQSLFPAAFEAMPTLEANVAGEYKICLEVWDDLGVKSCSPACNQVLVVPGDGIHLELLWDTPTDSNQGDQGPAAGADLDLHFAHPLAAGAGNDNDCDGKGDPWFAQPFDAFWFNPSPSWGDDSLLANDPSMDIDDTDGAGPEIIRIAAPEGTSSAPASYFVGVHYWGDHGFGASYATLSIYLNGAMAYQAAKVKLNPSDVWFVGKLHWPSAMVGGSLKLLETCHQTGNSCLAGKNLMWAPKGDYCITPCYDGKAFKSFVGSSSSGNCKGL